MYIKRTFYETGLITHYTITDNICNLCIFNPINYNIVMGYPGNCFSCDKSVVKCYKFKKIKSI